MQQEDDAIIMFTSHTAVATPTQSAPKNNAQSNSKSTLANSKSNNLGPKYAGATNGKPANSNRDRTLVKTTLVADATKGGAFMSAKMSLEDFGNSQGGGSFN